MSATTTLYVSDLDGTLLDADSAVSAESVAMLDEAITRYGIRFTVATARTPATVMPIMRGLRAATLPFIVIGGAAWWDPVRCDYALARVIAPPVVAAIDAVMRRHGVRPFIYRRHGSWLHTYHYGPMSGQERLFVEQRTGLEFKRFCLDEPHYLDVADDALFIFSMNRYDLLRVMRDDIAAAGIDCQMMLYHDPVNPDDGYFEISATGCTKASAILEMARRVGVERIVVFGDNRNDIAMMRAATVSIAPANAFDEVKAVATEVIGANTTHSVARWILDDARRQSSGNQ